jgi:glycosyltransferase involved in cell wall biosynthesis
MYPTKPKILFVAQPEAIHTARWISQLNNGDFDLHLFPSRQSQPIKEMPQLTVHSLLPQSFTQFNSVVKNKACIPWPLKRGSDRLRKWFLLKYRGASEQIATLAHVINTLKPDIVHTMEMQLAGYQMLSALRYIRNRKSFTWIYSCWGNDITFFKDDSEHNQKIASVIKEIDYYTADCPRDIELIKSFSPTGKPLPVFPTGGGYDLELLKSYRREGPVSKRQTIAVKGYHDDKWTGRAVFTLKAIELCKEHLKNYKIVVYRPIGPVRDVVYYLRHFHGIDITCTSDWEDHLSVIKVLGQSRISIATNSNDGMPNSVLESMIMGAFPIQSTTADTSDWITHGENGILVSFDDITSISNAIIKAIHNDSLVDNAAKLSEIITNEKLDRTRISTQVQNIYNTICSSQ